MTKSLSQVASAGMAAMAVAGCGLNSVPPGQRLEVSPRLAAAAAAGWEEWYLDVEDECTLYVKELGSGPPLVVLHGGWGAEHSYSSEAGRAAGRTMSQEWNFLPALHALNHPVKVINGDHDLVGFGGELHQRMLEAVPNVEFVLLGQAGHSAWVDQPERFSAELLRALQKYRH